FMNAKITSPGNVGIIRGLLMLTVLSAVSCNKHPQQPSADGFVTFDSFIQQTRSAKFEDYQGKPGVQVESVAAFEAMKAHLLQLYDGVHPTNTFFERNRFIDCVPLEQQPGLRRPGAPRESLQRPNLKETSAPSLQNPESDATGRK